MTSTADHAAPDGRNASAGGDDIHHVSPSDIAVGVVIGRTSEFFDFFVFAIASVIVFPQRLFPFADPYTATIYSFCIFALAFLARPVGTAIFLAIDRLHGRVAKLTIALFVLGTSTVAMGLVPSYDTAGWLAIASLCILRIGQGIALGGSWDGLASLLALTAPKDKRGFYAMVPQLGAPIGLIVATLLFAFLVGSLPAVDFLDWGWRYPFFVAFAINVVALFARLRIVATEEYEALFQQRELQPSRLRETIRVNIRTLILGIFVPLSAFALFHMTSVFPLSWVFLYTDEEVTGFLMIEALGAGFGLLAVVASGYLADRIGRRRVLTISAWGVAGFAILAPLLLSGDAAGETIYMVVGFIILGLGFGQSSGAVASLFETQSRYTASAVVSDLSWLFGAGFAPLTALLLTHWFGLPAAGLYLLSGAICTLIALWFFGRMMSHLEG
ncbi:MFS transporter [Pseudoroseicyclus aestuarii]|uniref:Nitrate/nitrite transporter NarK n=1 Tax=Pseudoroseicyclus aestuarii TaxID=1795041 RepID=A0A318SZB4_9RHOB|nr:MFS transporter [Pseudoroseicyclus aestuarii]PYE85107.1 nitrate/nitrite transporter NarK [Pseudoroseicyclus aestuarii]